MRDQTNLARARQMRREPTPPERKLWAHLRADQLGGAKFRRQVVIGPYIADFACRTPMKLVVEIDGETHGVQEAYDDERSAFLEQRGYRVLRFSNRDIMQDIESVLRTIATELSLSLL